GIVPFNSQDSDVVTFVDRVSDTNNEYIDTSVEIGKNYYYALYTYDSQHNYGEKVWIKGTPGSTSSAPTLQISSMESGKVELNWDQIEGAAGYRVYREDSKGTIIDKFVDQSSTPGVSVVFIDFVLQGDYTYWVTAVNEYGEGPYSERLSVTVGEDDIAEDVPAEPSNLIVEKVSDLKIGLNWVDNSINETGFVLERKTDDSDWGVIAGTEFNIDSYIDEDLQPGTIYYYRIKAVNSAGESEYTPGDKFIETSNVPVPVTDLSWEVVSANHIKVEWVDTPNEDNYKVELLELAEDGEIIDGEALDTQLLSGNTTYCYFVSLKPGKEYLVRVTSIRGQETVSIESDNIRTSTDPKGGLF
ncbi:MAG: fibronectin type III domain-containing protein, partial [Halanaerobiales bacterium]